MLFLHRVYVSSPNDKNIIERVPMIYPARKAVTKKFIRPLDTFLMTAQELAYLNSIQAQYVRKVLLSPECQLINKTQNKWFLKMKDSSAEKHIFIKQIKSFEYFSF